LPLNRKRRPLPAPAITRLRIQPQYNCRIGEIHVCRCIHRHRYTSAARRPANVEIEYAAQLATIAPAMILQSLWTNNKQWK